MQGSRSGRRGRTSRPSRGRLVLLLGGLGVLGVLGALTARVRGGGGPALPPAAPCAVPPSAPAHLQLPAHVQLATDLQLHDGFTSTRRQLVFLDGGPMGGSRTSVAWDSDRHQVHHADRGVCVYLDSGRTRPGALGRPARVFVAQ